METDREYLRVVKFIRNEGDDLDLFSLRLNAVLEENDLVLVVKGVERVPEAHEI